MSNRPIPLSSDLRRRLAALSSPRALWRHSALHLADLVTPQNGYHLERDLAYGALHRQRLDFYRAAKSRPGAPLLVFFYGGGWHSGEKASYRFVGQALAASGYDTAIPDYRLYPQVRFPAFMEDAAAAVGFLAQSHGHGAGRPIILMGHSAGAQIAMLLAFDRRYLGGAGVVAQEKVLAAIGLAGPYDFLPLRQERYKRVFPEESRAESQPIAFVRGGEPPVLLMAGTADRTVDPGNSKRLAARIARQGGQAELKLYPGLGHAALLGTLLVPLRRRAPTLDDILAFIETRAKAEPIVAQEGRHLSKKLQAQQRI
ncbi:alpha/beta hydrolase [Afifella pfennigii]|uniref:alpha/beta hydrolase n=1 Tax=Afifella pfennigii TaxID=209897 RepID=UPI00068FBA96|nr:alpha/beta hydrolase [Afifella pfennigii]